MSFMKLGGMTFGSMFKKPETLLYPFETKEPPAGLKGSIQVDVKTCILCGICVKRCPCGAISVDKQNRTWSINHFACIQCGYCTRECPKESLSMDPHYAAVSTCIESEDFTVPERKKAEE